MQAAVGMEHGQMDRGWGGPWQDARGLSTLEDVARSTQEGHRAEGDRAEGHRRRPSGRKPYGGRTEDGRREKIKNS